MVTPAEQIPAETSAPAVPSRDPALLKVEKCFEGYRAKIAKLQEENQKLRAERAEARALNSRVRRIPKKKAAEQPAADASA